MGHKKSRYPVVVWHRIEVSKMNTKMIAATIEGVRIFTKEAASWQVLSHNLPGYQVTCLTAHEKTITAGTTRGIYQSSDLGRTWREANDGLDQPHVRWLASHPEDPDLLLAGTEPAGIYGSSGGSSWRHSPEVADLRDRFRWYLPYSPEAGCVRGFAFHGDRVYAAVEVGGVLVSSNRGQTWALVQGSTGDPGSAPSGYIHPDVHSILVHPADPDLVFAPTGGGFYRSEDGGVTWELLYRCYCRAAWVDPANPNHILLGPADSVDRNGRIEESLDGGKTWRLASAGLEVPWPHHMVERFYQTGDGLLAVLSNGTLLVANLRRLHWEPIPTGFKRVNAVEVVQA
jgi:hypothetical protein